VRRKSIVKPIAGFETLFWFLFVLGILGWVFGYYITLSKIFVFFGGFGIGFLKLAELLKI